MLNILRQIVQEISSAEYFGEALQILVERVRTAITTQCCSVFLIDKNNNEYVLLATDGLNPDAVGKTRLKLEQGLVGLVGQRGEPINLENAPAHPNFHYFPEIGEERYKAFLGVPIIHHRKLLGVLVVQQEKSRYFDEDEEAFLVTISAQLGGVIAHAQATGKLDNLFYHAPSNLQQDAIYIGNPTAPGIGIGTAMVIYPLADLDAVPDQKTKNIKAEITAFNKALVKTRNEIRTLGKRIATHVSIEEKALFDAYLSILDSSSLGAEVHTEIRAGHWAQGALRKVIAQRVFQFESMDDEYLRERAADLKDLGRRVLSHLQQNLRANLIYPRHTILVGEEISAAALIEVPAGQLAGIVTIQGSSNSHVAILARAMGIPAVMGIETLPLAQFEEQEVILDGHQGRVYCAPSTKLKHIFEKLIKEEHKLAASLEELRNLPAKTQDDHQIGLWVNAGLIADPGLSLTAGAEGIGLYRTEVHFMNRNSFPTEDDQFIIYQQLLAAFSPQPVIMRVLDIGGDKMLSYFPIEEDNPFLGWRGIRIMLDHPEIFLIQLRAMLRANSGLNNLRIMLPMVGSLNETTDALQFIHQAFKEVQLDDPNIILPSIGLMIEIPSAVYQIKAFAQHVDFFSVGSNDLIQYLLAVDRNNVKVATLYDAFHPAVLQVLNLIVKTAHAANKPVGICGEIASDPLAIPLLLAMGFDSLSMNSSAIPRAKWVVRNFTLKQAELLLKKALTFDSSTTTLAYLRKILLDAGFEKLIGRER